jgi:hypothetical protein
MTQENTRFNQENIAVERDGEDYIVYLKIRFSFEFYHMLMGVLHKTALRKKKDYDLTSLLIMNCVHTYLEEGKKRKIKPSTPTTENTTNNRDGFDRR